MTPRILVVNADDLGICPEVDSGILETLKAGTVTAVSLMGNFDRSLRLEPYLDLNASLGLHFNLTFGRPISKPDKVPSLLGSDGSFISDPRVLLDQMEPRQAALELVAQLERFRAVTGRDPAQLNFHKHLHFQGERLFDLLLEIAGPERWPVRTLNAEMRFKSKARGIPTADHFVGDVCKGGYWTIGRLENTLANLPDGVTELMCHPGFSMQPRGGLWYGPERDVERRTFVSPEALKLLKPFKLSGFSMDIWKK